MASTSSVRRVLSNASFIPSSSRASSHTEGRRRLMGTASALSLPIEEQAPIDIQIFDIFDAPSRLGESSKLLKRASSSRATSARVERASTSTVDSSSSVCRVKPLPAPIIYDGPARPKHLAHGGFRARRTLMHARPSTPTMVKRSLSTLPDPVVFDGPSRLRPYGRDIDYDSPVCHPHVIVLLVAPSLRALRLAGIFSHHSLTCGRRRWTSDLRLQQGSGEDASSEATCRVSSPFAYLTTSCLTLTPLAVRIRHGDTHS